MFKSLIRDRILVSLLVSVILIRAFSLNESLIEQYYTYGFYPLIASTLRLLLGWIPFSVGDILYLAAAVFLVSKTWKMTRLAFQKKLKSYLTWTVLRKYILLVLWIYITFNLSWGLNYNRQGIAHQLGLDVKTYNKQELYEITGLLHSKLNYYAASVDSVQRTVMDNDRSLFGQAVNDYKNIRSRFPFLKYEYPSIKPSLYGAAGKYFDYTGYYNPFTAEAQLKNSIPVFLKPFVVNHEIAHQLGYAKENEASFVSFLVSRNSSNADFRYSVYYELFFDALGQLGSDDDAGPGIAFMRSLHPRVVNDLMEQRLYSRRTRNIIAPFMSKAYDKYLKMNNQPKGKATYGEVIAWLIAYMKKYGKDAI